MNKIGHSLFKIILIVLLFWSPISTRNEGHDLVNLDKKIYYIIMRPSKDKGGLKLLEYMETFVQILENLEEKASSFMYSARNAVRYVLKKLPEGPLFVVPPVDPELCLEVFGWSEENRTQFFSLINRTNNLWPTFECEAMALLSANLSSNKYSNF
uniref:Uncharacterized protein n=1 Tax=Graphocephala atropunctata TaxID=36148 RepID=A0A1B6LCT1_9HEMI